MKVGIVSDTHDNREAVESAVDTFEREDVDLVVHCGDFVAPFSAAPFDGDYDFVAVRGNNDGEWALRSTVEELGSYRGETAELALDGTSVAVYHGTSGAVVDALVDCGTYDYVFHGHTHEYGHEARDGTTRINPGGVPIEGATESPYAVVLDPATGEFDRYALLEDE